MSSFNRKKLKFLGISLATLTATTVTLVACGNWTFQRIQMLIQT